MGINCHARADRRSRADRLLYGIYWFFRNHFGLHLRGRGAPEIDKADKALYFETPPCYYVLSAMWYI